jgi:CelD/BcsL family acetyltransferase involved in cellulose biosynthesis
MAPAFAAGQARHGTAGQGASAGEGRGEVSDLRQIEVFDRIDDAGAAWRDLQCRAAAITPFQRIEWHRALTDAFGVEETGAVRIVVVREAGRPVALAPLALSDRLGCRTLSWLGAFRADYNGPLLDAELVARAPEACAKVTVACLEAAGPYDLLWLEKQSDGAPASTLPGFRHGRHFYRAHALTLGSTWAETYEKLHSKTTRRRLREKERKLERRGALAFRLLTERSEVECATRELMCWKLEQLRRRGQAGPFVRRDLDFFVRLACETPIARVFGLSVGGRFVAVCFALVHDRTLYVYQMAYDPAASVASPGQILLNKVMERAIGDGCRTVDFTIGDEPYKVKLCDRSSAVTRAWSAATPRGVAAGHVLQFAAAARDFAAGRPQVRTAIQAARRVVYAWTDAGSSRRAPGVGIAGEVR